MAGSEQRDADDQRALFDKVVAWLEAKEREDKAIRNFERRPFAFSLTRNGHLLTYQAGPGRKIGSGRIQWKPNPDGDEPFDFSVVRSSSSDQSFRLNEGPEGDLDAMAADIVNTFVQQTE